MDVLRDDVDLIAKKTVKELLTILPNDTPFKTELEKWDGSFGVDSTTSTFYTTFLTTLAFNVLNNTDVDKLYGWDMFDKRADPTFALNFIQQAKLGKKFSICPDTCIDLIANSYMQAVSLYNSLPSKRWGDLHRIRTEHWDISHVPIINQLFTSKNPTNGNGNTVAFGRHKLSTILGQVKNFDTIMSSNFLMFSDGNKAKYSVSNGQSEDLYSKHYNNRVEAHQNYELLEIPKVDIPAQPFETFINVDL